MIHLVSDTSTLYNIEEGKKMGVSIIPLGVTIHQKTYQELEEIQSEEFIRLIEAGDMPTSSQPSIGQKIEVYDQYEDADVVDLTMCDGLSGTYQSSCSARESSRNKERIHVINTKTLCTPHRYLLDKAVHLVNMGVSLDELLQALQESIEHSHSFLIPTDFSFLKRGGRLTPLAATVGGLLRMVPIMTQTEDRLKLEKYAIKRTYKGAVETILQFMKEHNVNSEWHIGVSHANNLINAQNTVNMIKNALHCEVELFELSPAFIAQGGPGCIAIQMIKR